MAGAGYKLFNSGDVLTAAQVNEYLMQQTCMVFADAAARTTALSGVVAEGMISYLKDTNAVEVYNGSAWVASDDPNAIQNTIVDAKGDLITATAADTPARLAVGANETRLVADSAAATGLKYVADTTNYAIAAKGDLLAGTAADTLAALSVGTNNYFLTPDSGASTGLKWGGDWTAFTPAWTGLTIGNGTTSGRYIQVGKSVFLTAVITLGSTSSVTGQINMTLPNSWTAKTANAPSGLCQLKDTGVAFYAGFCIPGTTAITLQRVGVTGGNTFFGSVDATNPFTWGNTDQIELAINLEIQ